MRPVRVWAGLIFLTLGVLGILTMSGALDWDTTVGEWWPVAIIGWGLAEMLSARSLDLDWMIVAAFGVTLLADQQNWAAEGLRWTMLFFLIGAAILAAPLLRKRKEARGDERPVSRAASAPSH